MHLSLSLCICMCVRVCVCVLLLLVVISIYLTMEGKESELEITMEEMRDYFSSGKTRDVSWRKSQLKGVLRMLEEQEHEFFRALKKDLGKHPAESYKDEIGTLLKSANYALSCLPQWMSGKSAKLPIAALLTSAEILPEPLGVILIIASWNFPIGLNLEPLIGALAAGNVAVLKPSEFSPASSSLLAELIPKYLDSKAVKVIEGDAEVGQRLVHQKWDKIFFTGSPRIGRIVMAAAARNLTPVTLELGGKCPAVFDSLSSSFDIKVAVQRVLGAKFSSCGGQVCIGADYVLVGKRFSSTLVETMKSMIPKMLGENPKESGSLSRIVNKHHFRRLKSLLSDPVVKASIVYGGSMDEDELYIEPTILLDPPPTAALMVDEIFGPLLPIITLREIEDSIKFINSRPKPLAIYAFTKSKQFKRRLISETSSGSLLFNDALIQYVADTVPFGGVGESGIGKYHGKFSFDEFSHSKAVIHRSFLVDFWFRFPPWNDYKLQLFRSFYAFNYLQVLLVVLGLKKPKKSGTN